MHLLSKCLQPRLILQALLSIRNKVGRQFALQAQKTNNNSSPFIVFKQCHLKTCRNVNKYIHTKFHIHRVCFGIKASRHHHDEFASITSYTLWYAHVGFSVREITYISSNCKRSPIFVSLSFVILCICMTMTLVTVAH